MIYQIIFLMSNQVLVAISRLGFAIRFISVSFLFIVPGQSTLASNRISVSSSPQKNVLDDDQESNKFVFQQTKSNYLDTFSTLSSIDRAYKSTTSFIDSEYQSFELVDKSIQNSQQDLLLDLDLVSDTQYWENNNLFVAEGNVQLSINGRKLKADRIEIDKLNKTIQANGNVSFDSGSNYFSAKSFKYDLKNNFGELEDVYGVIDIDLIPEELNLLGKLKSPESASFNQEKTKTEDVQWEESLTIEGGFDSKMKILEKDEDQIKKTSKWRLKASKILIKENGWEAQKASFTSDPYNPAQVTIIAYKVELKEDKKNKEDSLLKSEKSFLLIENTIKIPLGNRRLRVSKKEVENRWEVGIDGKDRDGLYVGRNLFPIKINDYYNLLLQPQYLIQRSLLGKTKSYPQYQESTNSPKVSTTTSTEDYFGLEAKLKGKTFNWDSEIEANITTFNRRRFADGSRYLASLKRSFDFGKIQNLETNIFASYRFNVDNGSMGSSDIYTSYGANVTKNGSWNLGNSKYNYFWNIGAGSYKAEEKNSRDLISSWRGSANSGLSIRTTLRQFVSDKVDQEIISPYSPKILKPGLFLNSNFESSFYLYKDNENQTSLTFAVGPELQIGNLSKKYFDYTKIAVTPSLTIKGGDSPFKFDNASDLMTLKIDFTQQLIGPLLVKHIHEYNIDPSSDYYGNSLTSKLSLMWQRRAYEFGLFYDFENQSGGISFALNRFSFSGNPDPF